MLGLLGDIIFAKMFTKVTVNSRSHLRKGLACDLNGKKPDHCLLFL